MSLTVLLSLFACAQEEPQKTDEMKAVAESTEEVENVAWNKVCPVCGGEVNADLQTATYDGKVYGFGCPGCPEKFREKPEDYVKNLNEDGTKYVGS